MDGWLWAFPAVLMISMILILFFARRALTDREIEELRRIDREIDILDALRDLREEIDELKRRK